MYQAYCFKFYIHPLLKYSISYNTVILQHTEAKQLAPKHMVSKWQVEGLTPEAYL